ncbi:MAG: putative Ig domain-containing protein, partial [Verrucomicrobiota bacterium]
LSVFNGTNPNGTWSLYVVDDDRKTSSGQIASGWSLTIGAAGNSEPVISSIPDQSTRQDTPTAAIPFIIDDSETPPDNLTLTRLSSNQILLPNTNIVFGGSSNNRSVTLTPAGSQSGTATVTITVSDGTNSVSDLFTLTVTAPSAPFAGTNAITILDKKNADLYPANLTVAGMSGTISKVTVTLTNLSHTAPPDLDILLVGPGGAKVVLMSDAGSSDDLTNATVAFDDAALNSLPEFTAITAGVYRPTSFDPAEVFTTPAPSGPYGAALSDFRGINPNGTWSLYVVDDSTDNAGTLSRGWLLNIYQPTFSEIQAQTNSEDITAAIPFTVGEVDSDPTNLTVTATSSSPTLIPSTNITVSGTAGNRTLTIKPATNQSGTATITLTAKGAGGSEASKSFQLTVTPVNDAPVLDAIADKPIDEGTNLTFTNRASDVDVPANKLTFSLEPGFPANATINATNGVFTWTPTEAQGPTNVTIGVRVTDDGTPTLSDVKNFRVTVREVNLPPTLVAPANQTITELNALSAQAVVTDPDLPPNTLTFSLVSPPAGATINANNGAITWTPTEAQGPSTNLFTVVVTDNGSPNNLFDTKTFTVIVQEANVAPVLSMPATQTVNELATLMVTIIATDPDVPTNTLSFSLVSPPNGVTINQNTGVLTWTPTEAQGPSTNTISVKVTDNGAGNLSDTKSFTVVVKEVNSAPTLAAIGDKTVDELSPLTFTASATDDDSTSDTLTFTLGTGAPTGALINANTGQFTWSPSEAQGPGSFAITVTVTDNNPGDAANPKLSHSQTINVTVKEINSAPALNLPVTVTINEESSFLFPIPATDSDLPTNTLSLALISGPQGATINANGAITWTPSEAQGPSTNTFTLVVTDNGTPSLSATQSFQIVVNEVNVAPTLVDPPDTNINEGVAWTYQLSASDADRPANTLTFALVSGPTGLGVSPAGLVNWTPSEAQGPGTYPVTVQVTDNGTPSLSANQSFQIVVNEVNVAPTLVDPPDTNINEVVAWTYQLSASDVDRPANTLTFALVSGPTGLGVSPAGLVNW